MSDKDVMDLKLSVVQLTERASAMDARLKRIEGILYGACGVVLLSFLGAVVYAVTAWGHG